MTSTTPGAGFEYPRRSVSWLKRDVLLFANSIGVRAEDLQFLYKGNSAEILDFYKEFASKGQGVAIPGVPKLDATRMVDAGRQMTFLKPLPLSSAGRQFEQRMRVIGVYDKGKAGTIVATETAVVDASNGEVYNKILANSFYIGQGVWGGPKGPPTSNYPPPGRRPDVIYKAKTTKETPFLYRRALILNGDTNPLHVVPEPGIKMGFKGNIIHGLFSYNVTAYAVLKTVGQGNSVNLKQFEARFASPVNPGDTLVVDIWKLGEVDDEGYEEIRFVTKVKGGETVLSNGRALVKSSSKESKI
ncbi:Peroxisomal hydratase-dehydrogenase-epimerase [Lachnellula willkommii]|uniref:Peroxisomal hydratase-dehydrogenase-epimerase n=1 Tax=Lachnellula willkommii TaxID=215461 RepID=A0A559MBD3_9HELO|nr:Peroxisomal hydratase-dehydrogenase-epimerase [Lachnellula willkommii]